MTGTLTDVPHQCIGARQGSFLRACLSPAVRGRPELRLARLHSTAGSSTRAGAASLCMGVQSSQNLRVFPVCCSSAARGRLLGVQAQKYFTSGPGEPPSSELLSSIAGSLTFACCLRTRPPLSPCAWLRK